MALNGNFSEYPVSGSQFGLYCEWSGVQNQTSAYTDVTLKVYLSYYNLSVSARNDCVASINGEDETFSTSAINDTTSSGWKKKLIKTKTVRVRHSSDGTAKGIKMSASWRFGANYEGTYVGTITAETTVDLDAISTNSILNNVSTIYVDSDAPVIQATITIYNSSYTHQLVVSGTNGLLVPFADIRGRVGPQVISLQLSDSQVAEFMNELGAVSEKEVTCTLSTYGENGAVGVASTVNAKIAVSQENSTPSFSSATYKDSNASTSLITGDNKIIIQNKSSLQITVNGASAKNGATIESYSATVGLKSVTSNTNVINFGAVDVYGEQSARVTVTDSRGFSYSANISIPITRYSGDITIDDWSVKRKNNVGDEVTLTFSGTFPALFSNSITQCYWTYQELGGNTEYGGELTITESSGRFTFTSVLSTLFDSNKAYYIVINISDKFSSDSEQIRLSRGTPQVEFRSGYVNVNDRLEVKGYGIGYVNELSDSDNLFNLTVGGVYIRATAPPTGKNYPSTNPGILEFIDGPIKLLRYTDITGVVKTSIAYDGQFTAWK